MLEIGDALKSNAELDWVQLGIGFVVSAAVGLLAIALVKWLLKRTDSRFSDSIRRYSVLPA